MKTISIESKIKVLSVLAGALWASLVVVGLTYGTTGVAQELDPREVLNQLVEQRVQADLDGADLERNALIVFPQTPVEVNAAPVPAGELHETAQVLVSREALDR